MHLCQDPQEKTNRSVDRKVGEMKAVNLEKLDEKELFIFIESVGGTIWFLEHEHFHGRIELTKENYQAIFDMREQLEQAVNLLSNFGIQPKDGDSITDDYWKWYEKQKDWFRELSEQEKGEYRKVIFE